MTEWWESLSTLQQVFYYVAVPFTIILIIQAIMTIFGLGGDDTDADVDAGVDGDFDADVDTEGDADFDQTQSEIAPDEPNAGIAGFRFFTVRGIVAFFCIFGWTGIALYETSLSAPLITLIAVVAGFIAMFVIGLMFFAVRRLQSSGNIKYNNAVGKTAEVYIPIPALRSGRGKVMVVVQERLVEAEALTDEEKKILTGQTVKVVGNIGNTLIVKR